MQTVRTFSPAAKELPEPGSLILRTTPLPIKHDGVYAFALLIILAIALPMACGLQVTP
ncbi:hypothetical protein [Rhizobium sp. S96]|uniref:hypothetical protein n=1 Tax=Rhizobium sp. S96 TaxID=3055140 RepID=UPI0025AA9081|nr:hypothetical protein [Rhizobium sp. S96]MDM9619102.1 hypothetical protein [Rhizobium sp. S96]